ncbi:hypothetical protein [Gimesia algae]|uniref:Zinc finger/thioredoxin putative domain-containing protein n=1 Tax=Gimesia algae TaxID=2527971 RepID=A0A517VJ25_9PLAN|nr:hypothetical protein [Gimesia algae]QDT93006.1 hypothetical protein Pan161_46780 [Gimesia algae]
MTISVQCEECFQSYKVKDERAGQTLKCKSCGSKIRVPAVEEEFEDLSADYGEPIAQPRKKKAVKAKKKKSSSRKSLNISAGGIVKKTFGVLSMALGVAMLGGAIYMFFAGDEPNGKRSRPVAGLLMASVFMGVGKKWMFDE